MTTEAPAIKLPEPLPLWRVTLYGIMFPVCLAAFLAAFAGLWVLTDHERKTWLGQTAFAERYRQVIAWNQMTSAVCFNGGILGSIISVSQLRKHRQARLLRNVKVMKAKDVVNGSRSGKKRR